MANVALPPCRPEKYRSTLMDFSSARWSTFDRKCSSSCLCSRPLDIVIQLNRAVIGLGVDEDDSLASSAWHERDINPLGTDLGSVTFSHPFDWCLSSESGPRHRPAPIQLVIPSREASGVIEDWRIRAEVSTNFSIVLPRPSTSRCVATEGSSPTRVLINVAHSLTQ